ncbi:hypothetical protein AB0F17_15995 [Nonomuraea sp. NPDC026600]|uniref:hypothetical protein n=1 Tax=Nonomuraea sp. NPDC026600 TaxID=3155363 RepID=UPI0033FA2849
MVASVRSVAATPNAFFAEGSAARGEVQPGDLMLAFFSQGRGSLANMSLSGGAPWGSPIASVVGPAGSQPFAGTKILRKYAGADEPEAYDATFGSDNLGAVITILAIKQGDAANIQIVSADGSVAPAVTPGAASGLEIRYGAASSFGPLTWADLPGYDGLDMQADNFASISIAVRAYLSTSPMAAVDLDPSSSSFPMHAFTVLVHSSGSGGTPPTPPVFPVSTPGRGESHIRTSVHDLLTGAYYDDIFPSGLTLSRLNSQPGAWRGRLDLASRSEARKIGEMFPPDYGDMTAGPGRLVAHTYRSGVLWGIHWLHTTDEGQDARGNPYLEVSGSTLDAYPLYVAIEEQLSFGDDQLQNARDLISHMQATAASNIGLGLMAGSSGVIRLLEVVPGPNVFYGNTLADYAKASDGFEFVVNPRIVDGGIVRSLEFGAPKLTGSGVHTFFQGDDGGTITSWRITRSALAGATRWGAYGGTPQQEDATEGAVPVKGALVTTPHVAAGYPIIDKRPTHPGASTDQTVVDRFVEYWAARAPGAPPVFTFDVTIGAESTLGPNSIGDQVRAVLDNPRYPIKADGSASFDKSQRLIGWELTPADRGAGGKDKLRLITETGIEE